MKNRDAEIGMNRFSMHKARDLLGCALAFLSFGVASAEILVGQSIPRSGSLALFGEAINKGAEAYVDRVNARGGIRGEKLRLLLLDDAGDTKRTVENAKKLSERGGVALFGSIEGGPCTALLAVALEYKVPLVACMAGAPQLRDPFNAYAFPVRAAHLSEFEELLRYASQHGLKRLAFVHSDSDTGRLHLANVTRLSKKYDVALVAPIALSGKVDVEDIAKRIIAAGADSVLNHGGYAMYAELLKSVRAKRSSATFLAVNSGGQQMAQLMGNAAAGVVMSQVVPYPWSRATKIQREYQDDLKRRDPNEPLGFSSMEGYLSAKLLVEALNRAGAKPTREKLRVALQKMGRVDLDGFEVMFSSDRHEGSKFVDITQIQANGGFLR
jgi:branched-chain amino acid transport system substrate-binding protein